MAVVCDFENIAIGVREAKYSKFDIKKVLERLLVKGSIVVKKAYCDWDRYKEFKPQMHEAAFELIEIPHVRQSGKNSADIRMVVDALEHVPHGRAGKITRDHECIVDMAAAPRLGPHKRRAELKPFLHQFQQFLPQLDKGRSHDQCGHIINGIRNTFGHERGALT